MGIYRSTTALAVSVLAWGLVLTASSVASAVTFTEGATAGATWSDTIGQNFIVGLGPSPDPMLTAGDPVKLDSFLTFRAGAGSGDPDAEVFLAITDGAFFDWNGDPDGSFAPTASDVLAVSANSFNPSTLAAGDPMAFTFGAGVDVLFGGSYAATYVTIDGSNNLTPVAVGSLIGDWTLDELLGVFIPAQNHGVQDDFNATALFADFDANGFLEGCGFACDMSFLATFSTAGALDGDLNGDGFVGIADLNIVLGVWNQNVTPGSLLAGDPTGDGFVGIADLNVVLGNWNAGTPPAAGTGSAVPEPTTAATLLLLAGAVCVPGRRGSR